MEQRTSTRIRYIRLRSTLTGPQFLVRQLHPDDASTHPLLTQRQLRVIGCITRVISLIPPFRRSSPLYVRPSLGGRLMLRRIDAGTIPLATQPCQLFLRSPWKSPAELSCRASRSFNNLRRRRVSRGRRYRIALKCVEVGAKGCGFGNHQEHLQDVLSYRSNGRRQ